MRQEQLPCHLNVVVHRGVLYAFRSYLYGPGINIAASVETASKRILAQDEGSVFVTGEVRGNLAGAAWDNRLELTDVRSSQRPKIDVYRLGKAKSDSNSS